MVSLTSQAESPLIGRYLTLERVRALNVYDTEGVAPVARHRSWEQAIVWIDSTRSMLRQFSDREVTVLRMCAEGYTSGEIAEELRCCLRTIANLMAKLRWKMFGYEPDGQRAPTGVWGHSDVRQLAFGESDGRGRPKRQLELAA